MISDLYIRCKTKGRLSLAKLDRELKNAEMGRDSEDLEIQSASCIFMRIHPFAPACISRCISFGAERKYLYVCFLFSFSFFLSLSFLGLTKGGPNGGGGGGFVVEPLSKRVDARSVALAVTAAAAVATAQ